MQEEQRLQVVIVPDSFGGSLTSAEATEAIAQGWRQARPQDDLVLLPLADGGEGTLDVVAGPGDRFREAEVADPLGRPRRARWLRRGDGSALVESAEACGLWLLDEDERDPLRTTTYGVGQLLDVARRAGARHIDVGLGGSATVDGGAGALTALGLRALRNDGQGVKIGGGELRAVDRVERGWLDEAWADVEVVLWADVTTPLIGAAATFGPQKGATPAVVETLEEGLARWADVVERDLGGVRRDGSWTGAAGGLGFGLAGALDARFEPGAAAVASAVGLRRAMTGAGLLVTGEGRLDGTSAAGKVVGTVLESARDARVRTVAVVGQATVSPDALADLEAAAPEGPGEDPGAEVTAAAARLARRL